MSDLNVNHRPGRAPRLIPVSRFSSPGDIGSSRRPARPPSCKRSRVRVSHTTFNPLTTDYNLETIFMRTPTTKKRIISTPNETGLNFDNGARNIKQFNRVGNSTSNVSVFDSSDPTDSEDEDLGCLSDVQWTQEDDRRSDTDELVQVASRHIGLERKYDNADLAHLLSTTPSAQDMESLLLEGVVSSPSRSLSRRGFTEKEEDDALHAASRNDKKLTYYARETSRMHSDLEKLRRGYKATKIPATRTKRDSSQMSDDLEDVKGLSEMVATLEGQLERMSVRSLARQQTCYVNKYRR